MNQQGETRYFYKGTCFPIPLPAADQELIMECAKDCIAGGLRDGDTMKSLATLFKAQLDEIIEKLVELEKKNNGKCSREDLVSLAANEPFTREPEHLVVVWAMNVCALLIMKEIEDDEMNGVLTHYKKGNTLFCEMGRDPRAAAAQEPAPKPKKNKKKKKLRIVRSKGLSKRTHR